MELDLSGKWQLYVVEAGEPEITAPAGLAGLTPITGKVPGNLELDLMNAGKTGDPFIGENAKQYRHYEFCDFWYCRTVEAAPEMLGSARLVLEGADCFTDVFWNGVHVGGSDNAFIPAEFAVTVQPQNQLAIRIRSAELEARKFPDEPAAFPHTEAARSAVYCRKPAHSTGWDICPRLNLGGLWKTVKLVKPEPGVRFSEIWPIKVTLLPEGAANVELAFHLEAGRFPLDDCTVEFSGVCEDSVFSASQPAWFTDGRCVVHIEHAKLWNPTGYGKPYRYTVTARLRDRDGAVVAEAVVPVGVRTVQLDRTELNIAGKGRFGFVVNGVPVRIHGANHVPLDALHSRDVERMHDSLELFRDLNCNMIRVWGGGVYESDAFYDYCDEHGILVWQDFMFGCFVYPQNETFFAMVRPEAEYTVRRLRKHPSLVLWCGDNECDQFYNYGHRDVSVTTNRLNREVLPDIVRRLDPSRPYLASSPYVAPEAEEAFRRGHPEVLPERHLWGARETFKLPFYYASGAKFISETGWHGCPNVSSLKKFLTPAHQHWCDTDPEWDYHASNPFGQYGFVARSQLIGKQLVEYFRGGPTNLEEYAQMSQIHQAEAKKFAVEQMRLDPNGQGILWWNVIDAWPQFSDSVVDYYYGKKLAYHYLKRSQTPFCILFSEPIPWESAVTAVNDSNEPAAFSFTVENDTGIVLQGTAEVAPYGRKVLGTVRIPRGTPGLWIVRWENRGVKGGNHYVSGNQSIDFAWYMQNLPRIAAIDHAFNAEELAK